MQKEKQSATGNADRKMHIGILLEGQGGKNGSTFRVIHERGDATKLEVVVSAKKQSGWSRKTRTGLNPPGKRHGAALHISSGASGKPPRSLLSVFSRQ